MTCLVDAGAGVGAGVFQRPARRVRGDLHSENASGALKLVGESYPFGAGDQYLLTFDNHNSVNGIRESPPEGRGGHLRPRGVLPELRMDQEA